MSLSPDQGSNYFAAQMISAHIFYASEPGSHRYMSSIITLNLQQPWLLAMMLVSSSLMNHQYCIDFSFGFNFFCTTQVWDYRIEKLSNADISYFSVYRRVYGIEPPISSISIFSKPVIFLSFFAKNSPKIPKILRKFQKIAKNSENSENSPKIP